MTTGCRLRRLTRRHPRKQSVRISARGLEPRSGEGRLHGQVPPGTIFRDVLTGQRTSDLEKVDGSGESRQTPETPESQETPEPRNPEIPSNPGPRHAPDEQPAETAQGPEQAPGAHRARRRCRRPDRRTGPGRRRDPPSGRPGGRGRARAPRTRRLRPRRDRGPRRGPAPGFGPAARQPVPPEPGQEHHVPAVPRPRTDAPLVPPELRRAISSRAARRLGDARLADPRPHDRPPAVRSRAHLRQHRRPGRTTTAASTWSASSPRSRRRPPAGVSTPATCPRSPRATSTSWSRARRSGRRTT